MASWTAAGYSSWSSRFHSYRPGVIASLSPADLTRPSSSSACQWSPKGDCPAWTAKLASPVRPAAGDRSGWHDSPGRPARTASPACPAWSASCDHIACAPPGLPHLLVPLWSSLAHWLDPACLLTLALVLLLALPFSAHLGTYAGLTCLCSCQLVFFKKDEDNFLCETVFSFVLWYSWVACFTIQYSFCRTDACQSSHVWTLADRDCSHCPIHGSSSHYHSLKDRAGRD